MTDDWWVLNRQPMMMMIRPVALGIFVDKANIDRRHLVVSVDYWVVAAAGRVEVDRVDHQATNMGRPD